MVSVIITRGGGKGSGAFITGYKIQVKEDENDKWMWLTNAYTMTTVPFLVIFITLKNAPIILKGEYYLAQ